MSQYSFLTAHCVHFEDSDENKLIYTSVFNNYTQKIEAFISSQLDERIPNFNMAQFLNGKQ